MQHSEHPRPEPPCIPPELRGHIATFCDRQSLVALLSADRLWSAEAEPVLFKSVHLSLGRENATAVLGFMDGLTRSARRASFVRRLLLEHSGHDYGCTPGVLPALGAMLLTLPNLVDLRLLGHNFTFLATILTAIESPQRLFGLHTLYLSQRLIIETPNFFKEVLRAHAASLRVVGIHAVDARFLWSAARAHWQDPEDDAQNLDLTQSLRADCVRFAFVRRTSRANPAGRLALFIHAASAPNIAAVARSLADEPSDQFSQSGHSAPVETLQMEWDSASEVQVHAQSASRAELLSPAFSAHFPLVKKLELLIRGDIAAIGLDLDALVKTAAPFRLLEVLDIMQYRPSSSYHGTIPESFRSDLMHKLIAAGCERFREIRFPDGTRTSR